ncbi:MAG: LamG-like jellyroll fold domain-containing protein [Candidatus Paceibacterota bacterium]|jgi:prepilin-type N-terminal cleavage/methylation domain-containing protein
MENENIKIYRLAFTLIELLVVIAIIDILSGLIVVSMGGITDKANIAKSQVFSNSLRNSLMLNLISEWKLDQVNVPSADRTPDSWSGGNTGTLKQNGWASACDTTHCPQLQTTGCVSGNCLSFDGVDDYVDVGSGAGLNMIGDFTFSVWAKLTSTNNNQMLLDKREQGGNDYTANYYLDYNYSGTILFLIGGGGTTWSLTQTSYLPLKNVYHLYAAVKSGTNTYIYIDGLRQAIGTCNFTPYTSGTQITTIGSCNRTGCFLSGLIDDVRIYNAAMSAS